MKGNPLDRLHKTAQVFPLRFVLDNRWNQNLGFYLDDFSSHFLRYLHRQPMVQNLQNFNYTNIDSQ